jgi:hypothetical protein
MLRHPKIRMFMVKKSSAMFEHQDYLSTEAGVLILAHGRCAPDATEGDCGALVLARRACSSMHMNI